MRIFCFSLFCIIVNWKSSQCGLKQFEDVTLVSGNVHLQYQNRSWSYFKDSPVTFLVKVPAALRAVLLVTLWLVQAVGGALPHLGILGKHTHTHKQKESTNQSLYTNKNKSGTSHFANPHCSQVGATEAWNGSDLHSASGCPLRISKLV